MTGPRPLCGPIYCTPDPMPEPALAERAIWLVHLGEHIEVRIETSKGQWATLIRERADAPFSHIAEAGAIRNAALTQPTEGSGPSVAGGER